MHVNKQPHVTSWSLAQCVMYKMDTETVFENQHAFPPISYFIVIVVCFNNIWTRSSTLPERHEKPKK